MQVHRLPSEISIGRGSFNDIVVGAQNVSHLHCVCFEHKGKFYIQDKQSTNGTFVDDRQITDRVEFTASSVIRLATVTVSAKDIIDTIRRKTFKPALYEKINALITRHTNNVRQTLAKLEPADLPYKRVFENEDKEQEYYIARYQKDLDELLTSFRLIEKSSLKDNLDFKEEMAGLSNFVTDTQERRDIQNELTLKLEEFQEAMVREAEAAIRKMNEFYVAYFSSRRETTTGGLTAKEFGRKAIVCPFVLFRETQKKVHFFDRSFTFKYWSFVPFLKKTHLIVKGMNGDYPKLAALTNSLLTRLIAGSAAGNVQMHMVDLKDLNGTCGIFKTLNRNVFRLYSRYGDLQNLVSLLENRVENVIQNLLQGADDTLCHYNENKEKQEPYHIVVLKNFPYGISPDLASRIRLLLNNCLRAGVHFLFLMDEQSAETSEGNKIVDILQLDNLNASLIDINEKVDGENIPIELSDEDINAVARSINADLEITKDVILRLTDYLPDKSTWWTGQTASRADIPFGLSQNKEITSINLTQESGQNTALVIGIPGSGKSVFLHVVISNAIAKYSPKELQMYLLDFSGVEFNIYAEHNVPHMRVIAPEAEREFGLSVLKEIYDEGARRMDLCRENGVSNIVQLKEKRPEVVVPRLLVIIDEFQKIFEIESDLISREANHYIHTIIQEYRKFGINLILATQKLPAKSIVPYDLVANRVVFKSDPNDFYNLIKWPSTTPQPRLLTGDCIYNNETGAPYSNVLSRSFYINTAKESGTFLTEILEFASSHREDLEPDHTLRVFRGGDLPEFQERVMNPKHKQEEVSPEEVGIYLGESIAIAPYHVYVPLHRESNNNILIIGGPKQDIARRIAYFASISECAAHELGSCDLHNFVFTRDSESLNQELELPRYSGLNEVYDIYMHQDSERVIMALGLIRREIEMRKADPSAERKDFYLNIFALQLGAMFDGVGSHGDMSSEASRHLEYILKNGPIVGVFTILQVDTLANLNKVAYQILNQFNYRIALQMSEGDSQKVVGNASASKLTVVGKPATEYRALLYNQMSNSIVKFKPYAKWNE